MLGGSTGEPGGSPGLDVASGSRRTVPSGKITSGNAAVVAGLGDQGAARRSSRPGENACGHRAAPEHLPQLVRPGPTTTRRRCGSCTARCAAPRPTRAASPRSRGGRARRAAATAGSRSGRSAACAIASKIASPVSGIAPVAPRDEQRRAWRAGWSRRASSEELAAGRAVEPLAGEHEGDVSSAAASSSRSARASSGERVHSTR